MLYHGTTNARLDLIKLVGFVNVAPSGDRHVSLTDALEVAIYFAKNSASCDDADERGPVVLAFNEADLLAEGLPLEPFVSDIWGDGECDWERETACLSPIPARLIAETIKVP